MISWRRLYPKPAGSLPGGVVTQWGVGVITIFVLLFLTYWIYFGAGEEAELAAGAETGQAPAGSFTDQMAAHRLKRSRFEPRRADKRRNGHCSSRHGSNDNREPPAAGSARAASPPIKR